MKEATPEIAVIPLAEQRTKQAILAEVNLTEKSIINKVEEMDWLIDRRKKLRAELAEMIRNG